MPLLGAHMSIAGGYYKAVDAAAQFGMDTVQIFTKNNNQWRAKPLTDEDVRLFREALERTGVRKPCAHDSYLINLASPDDLLRLRSLLSFITELKRCRSLGVPFIVSHPGNFMNDRASGLERNAEALGTALECAPGETIVLLETTAGSGTALGASFEELAAIIELLPAPLAQRVGVCVDTAHIFAAGYNLVGDYDGVWNRLADSVGWQRLRMMHLNDSKAPLGSRRDRHELIGEGAIGEEPFRRIMNDTRFAAIPKVLETPKLDDPEATDRKMLARLRSYCD
jgi:deoxyribonuclease-4